MKQFFLKLAALWLALVWGAFCHAQTLTVKETQGFERLSSKLNKTQFPPDSYPLGAMWRTPEEVERQQGVFKGLLTSLDELLAKGRISKENFEALKHNLHAMSPTGRVPLAMVDGKWLEAYPSKDPLLGPNDAFEVPLRPISLRVMAEDGRVCEIPHREGLQATDYVQACLGASDHNAWGWVVQPNARVQRVGLKSWNKARQDQPAPGSWVWVPAQNSKLPPTWSQRWAEWLATQGVSNRLPLDVWKAPVRQAYPEPVNTTWLDLAGRYAEPEPTASNWGNVGLLQTPTARMQKPGYFGLTFHRTWPYQHMGVFFQPVDWLEAGFRYVDTSNRLYGPEAFSGSLPDKDKSFDVKVRAWQESDWLPEFAVGIRDVGGTGLFSSEYMVASKRTGRVDWSLGMGWGYLGGRGNLNNPLSRVLGQGFNNRVQDGGAQGGQLSTGSWFHGPVSWFGGLEYQTPWNFNVKVEYDGNHYQREPQNNNLPVSSPINWAVVYKPTRGLDVSMGIERGNTWSMGLTFYVDMAGLNMPKVTDPPRPAPNLVRPKANSNWQQTANDLSAHTLWDVPQLYKSNNTLVVDARNSFNVYNQERLDKAVAVLNRDAPEDIENFEVHHHKAGDVLAVEKVNRTEWVKQQTQPARTAQPIEPVQPVYEVDRAREKQALLPEKAVDFWVEPGLDLVQTLGGPDGYLYQLSGALWMGLELPKNFKANSTLRYRLSDNYERFTPGWSYMPQVRTHIAEYLNTRKATLDSLTISKTERLDRNWYATAYAGYFEMMFGGVGGEVLYRQPGSKWAMGLDVNHVRQRSFEQDLSFRDYKINTGHLTGYWMTPFEGIHTSLSVGQYLAGDRGATWSISKVFRNGSSLSAYATKTNVPAAVFGEGSFDKGIAWTIPFDAFLTSSSRYSAGWSWKPLLRDGGARVTRPVNLFAETAWVSPVAKAYRPAPPPNDRVAPDDRVEDYLRQR